MVKSKFLGVILLSVVFFMVFAINSNNSMATQNTPLSEGPSWSVGDWWILEQTKKDIAAPTPYWKEPLRWRCEVKKYSEDPNLFILEIRSMSGLKTGVDLVYRLNPWEVKKIRKMIGTADGVKTLEREINSSGPVMELDSPFSLVLPGFPLEDMTSSYAIRTNDRRLSNSGRVGPIRTQASGARGPIVGIRYNLNQEVSLPKADDPLTLRGEKAANEMKGDVSAAVSDISSKVSINMGRNKALQLWSRNAPWALVEETPHSKTTLIENHKGVTP